MDARNFTNVLALAGIALLGACSTKPCPAVGGKPAVATAPRSISASPDGSQAPSPSKGWFLAGSAAEHYLFEVDGDVKRGATPSTRLRAKEDPGQAFGTVMRTVPATPHLGKRVRFSAFVRTEAVTGWTGLWMRIDRKGRQHGPFDNMEDRPIQGTTEWTRHEVVLEVPPDAETVNFGVLQAGPGTSWIDEYALEQVDRSVATSAIAPQDVPAYCAAHPLKASGSDPLIEDVEDGDRSVRKVDGRAGKWWLTRDDGCQALPSDPSAAPPTGNNLSRYAMRGGARDCRDWGFDLGFALNGLKGLCAYDASFYDGVYFWARSGHGEVALRFRAGTRQTQPTEHGGDGTCDAQKNGCWDEYGTDIKLAPSWKLYSAKWSELKQMGWGKAVPFNVKELSAFHWTTSAKPTEYREIWVDQVGFFKGAPPKTPP